MALGGAVRKRGVAMANGDSKDEYADLSENMRHYANMRFAQITLFSALTAGLFTATFLSDPKLPSNLVLILKLLGAVATFAFGVMEERAADYWHHFRKRAEVLERNLGYQQYTGRPAAKYLSATNAARLLIWGVLPLWVASVIFCP